MLIVNRLEHYIVDGGCDAKEVGGGKLLWIKFDVIYMKYILHTVWLIINKVLALIAKLSVWKIPYSSFFLN